MPFPSPGDLPDPGVEPVSCALAGRFFTSLSPPGLQRPPTNFIPKGWRQGLYFFKSTDIYQKTQTIHVTLEAGKDFSKNEESIHTNK